MIVGVLLAVFASISITSLIIIVAGAFGVIRENLITGAVIGTTGLVSYAIIAFVLSLAMVFFLALILKNPSLRNKRNI